MDYLPACKFVWMQDRTGNLFGVALVDTLAKRAISTGVIPFS